MSERFHTDKLAELIDRKHEVLSHMRELARRQADIIAEGDMSKLLALLAAKQQQLDQLQAVEGELDPYRQDDPDQRTWRSAADRQRCRHVAEKCEALLKEIVVIEKQSEADLVRRRDNTANKLDAANCASEARNAYAQKPRPSSKAIDLTSQS